MGENIEVKDVQKTEYLDKNGLDMLWAKVKENTHNQVEVERNRAVAKENSIVDTKADKSALDNYVLSTTLAALEQKVTANTTAISAKQDAGNYITYTTTNNEDIGDTYVIDGKDGITSLSYSRAISLSNGCLEAYDFNENNDYINYISIDPHDGGSYSNAIEINNNYISFAVDWATLSLNIESENYSTTYGSGGVYINQAPQDSILTAHSGYYTIGNGLEINSPTVYGINKGAISIDPTYLTKTIDERITTKADKTALTALEEKVTANTATIDTKQPKGNYLTEHQSLEEYAKKTELPTVPTKTSELTNDSNFITADYVDDGGYYLYNASLNLGVKNNGVLTIQSTGISSDIGDGFSLNDRGITFYSRGISDIPTAHGSFIDIDDYALKSQVTALEQTVTANTAAIEGKQDKGNYIPYTTNNGRYEITSPISVAIKDRESVYINTNEIIISQSSNPQSITIERNKLKFIDYDPQMPNYSVSTEYTINGITSKKYNNCLATSDGTFKPISDFVLSSVYNEKIAALEARITALEAKHTEAAA